MSCESVPTPLQTVIDVLICFLMAGSYIPQLIRIASTGRSSHEGISGWYIVLLTLSASTFLAARVENGCSQLSFENVRSGQLRGWKAFSALVIYFQVLVQWLAAISLLVVYVAYRQHPSARGTDDTDAPGATTPLLFSSANDAQQPLSDNYAPQKYQGEAIMQQASPPSNTVILAIVSTHAALVFPISLAILIIGRPRDESQSLLLSFFQTSFHGFFLVPSGILFALASAVPQIRLIGTRFHDGLGLGDLSVLSLGLQVLALAALGVSQGLRLGWPHMGFSTPLAPLPWFLSLGGPAVGFGVLAVGQLLVLAVALGVEAASGGVHL